MMIASIAVVGMLLAVGIGYAAYTGTITSDDNSVQSQYVYLETDNTSKNVTLPTKNIVYNTYWDGSLYNTTTGSTTIEADTKNMTYNESNEDTSTVTAPVSAKANTAAQIFGYTTVTITSTENVAETFTLSMKIADRGTFTSKVSLYAHVVTTDPTSSVIGTTDDVSAWTQLTTTQTPLAGDTLNKAADKTELKVYVVFAAFATEDTISDASLKLEEKTLDADDINATMIVASSLTNQSH